MNRLAQTFAEALYVAAHDAADTDAHDSLIANLKASLARRGMQNLFPDVVRAYERLMQLRDEKGGVHITLAHEKDAALLQAELLGAAHELGVHGSLPAFSVDKSLIGGFRIEANARVIDASYKQRLLSLYRNLTH